MASNKKIITREELFISQHNYETLKTLIMTFSVSLIDILKSQRLCANFCIKYIMNERYQCFDEDKHITLNTIKLYQPHITDGELVDALFKATNKLSRGERIDSIEDFETFMNK
jgi:hypothetical protein